MTVNLEHYARLAPLFEAPDAGLPRADPWHRRGSAGRPTRAAASSIETLAGCCPGRSARAAGAAPRTFDVQAITSLDIGYTLFGEDYKRGALLANLSAEHTQAEQRLRHRAGGPPAQRAAPAAEDGGQVRCGRSWCACSSAPALREMIREFEPARIAKKEEIYKKHHKTIIEPPRASSAHRLPPRPRGAATRCCKRISA